MSRGTIHRTVRVDDALWAAAKEKAEAEGVSLSEIIRQALQTFVDRD